MTGQQRVIDTVQAKTRNSGNLKMHTRKMHTRMVSIMLLLGTSAVAADPISDKKSDWHGFDRYEFSVTDRRCWVVVPKIPAEGRPWIWRARFFGVEPQTDIALLKLGFHLAYCDVSGMFGSPRAVEHWNAFYRVMTQQHQLAARPALEGLSRGGLIIYNWAARNPEKVACIYGDAPVCDFKSWPAGQGQGKGSSAAWAACLKAYGMSEAEALAYRKNPIDNLQPLARANVPLLHVVGDADVVVPVAENTSIMATRYRQAGGSMRVINKPGIGHHPHSLKDPGPIVSFILQHTQPNVRMRGSLQNSRIQFEKEKQGHVAFIGGSITEMNGYRPQVCQLLEQQFPETDFTFTSAGIASTCSTTGAFRLRDDVLSKGPVDLFFIEFAVNDQGDAGHSRQACIRGLEGIIRQTRLHNPNADLVVTYFVNPTMLAQLQSGNTPLPIEAHEAVARHYHVPTIHLAKEIAEQITAEKITWRQFGGTHPSPFGNSICTSLIQQLLSTAWKPALTNRSAAVAHAIPTMPLEDLHYGRGRFLNLETANLGTGWTIQVPDWKTLTGRKRSRFTSLPMLCAHEPGSELTLKFSGTAVGAYLIAGPDAGVLEARVDDGEFQQVNLFHRFSKGLHYPRTVMFATDLTNTDHVLTLRIGTKTSSAGTAARIMKFVAN